MRVILAYKNFAANRNISHIGLGVSAINTCKVLNAAGISCQVWPILSSKDLHDKLSDDFQSPPITHVIISAPWIPTTELNLLCQNFPKIRFAVLCHSNVGFLQADPSGTRLFREELDLEMSVHNFSAAANSLRLSKWIHLAYDRPCAVLPNLYYLHGITNHSKPLWDGGLLRIGTFGATRPQKNLASAIAAAVEIASLSKAQCEIWISSGRSEGGGHTILNTVKEIVSNMAHVVLREAGWISWPQFRHLVGTMHLLLQPSYTESFNMVTADGIAEGVPSVVSDAIDWVPESWVARSDDVSHISHCGLHLLNNRIAAKEGLEHLISHVEAGLKRWKTYLESTLIP